MEDILESLRYSKIVGDFGERIVTYLLSKNKIECGVFDYIGIDIIAAYPDPRHLMGISVKCRSREEKSKGTGLYINYHHFHLLQNACDEFLCTPYFALVIDDVDKIYVYLLTMKKLLSLYRFKDVSELKEDSNGEKRINWKMTQKWIDQYEKDDDIMKIIYNLRIGEKEPFKIPLI